MIIAGFESLDELRYLIKKNVPGIFVPSWMAENSRVYEIIKTSGYDGIVATDNEGGYASWVVKGFPSPYSAGRLVERYEGMKSLFEQYSSMAHLLRAKGINMNLAPILDVHDENNAVIGGKGRAFSDDPFRIIAMAEIFRRVHAMEGVEVVFKHFLGQGRAGGDPHTGISVYKYDEGELNRDIIPFAYFSAAKVGYFMTAHVIIPFLDDKFPVTLSRKILQGLLRQKLGFEGKVISDDMRMSAVEEEFGFDDSVRLALRAGVDYILVSRGLDYVERALSIIKEFV